MRWADFSLWRAPARVVMVCIAGTSGCAIAQGYPSKTVRLVAPYSPGGPNDLIARIVAQRMTQTFTAMDCR